MKKTMECAAVFAPRKLSLPTERTNLSVITEEKTFITSYSMITVTN